MKQLTKHITLILLLFSVQIVISQSFTAKTSRVKLGMNERFKIQYSIDKQGVDDFRLPNLTNFKVVAGPMQSTNFEYINGKQSFNKSFTYTIQPIKTGKYTIPPATATYNGKALHSNTLTITVIKGVAKPKESDNAETTAKANVFLVAEISNYSPYVGESVSVVYKLYMNPKKAAVHTENESKAPTYSGFWNQNIPIKSVVQNQGKYKGEKMPYYILRKDVLIPQQAGKIKITPMKIDISAVVAHGKARRDFFGRIVGGQKKVNLTISSGHRTVTVKALPVNNKPENFDGAVGDFKFTVVNSKPILKANESGQITIKVSGKGNLKLVSLPKIETPKGLEEYEPEHKENIRTKLSGQTGYTQDTYTVVPQFRGKYKIPTLSFSYFNPKTASYQTITSNSIIIDVPEGKMPEESDVSANKPNSIQADHDIRFIHTKTTLTETIQKNDFFKSNLFYLLLLLPMLSIPIGIFLGNKKRKRTNDFVGNKRRKADKLARKYLSKAKKELGNKEPFYIALEKALHNYLKAKLQVETSDISKEKISTILVEKSIDNNSIALFIKVLNDCDFARYTPISNVQMESDYQNAFTIITTLDKQLNE